MTPEQRLQVFMLYPNAQVIDKSGVTYMSFAEQSTNVNAQADFEYIEIAYNFKCQLILRGIDQLTEEEKIDILNMEGIVFPEENELKSFELDIEFSEYRILAEVEGSHPFDIEHNTIPYYAADYLRSKNIALPYMGIDLFKEIEKLNTP